MDSADVAQIAAVVGAAGSALALLARSRAGLLAGLLLLGAGEALLVSSLVPREDLRLLVASPPRSAALALAAAGVVAAGIVLSRFLAVVPLLALAAAPFRVPVALGDQEAFLLLPLYAVIAASVVALAVVAIQTAEVTELPRALAWPAAAFVALSALSLLWTEDSRAGTIELVFFLLPFGALVAVVARCPLSGWLPRALVVVLVVEGLVFAGVGIWQLWSEALFFARDLEVANAYTSYFRTTSLFADSSIYSRHLVLAIVVLVAALWFGRVQLWLAVAAIAALWTGLYFSYSQSSMVALVVALLALSLVAADRRSRRVLLAGAAAFVLAAAAFVAASVRDQSADRFTSGRSALVETTWAVFRDHPLVGAGIGAQPKASRDEPGGRRQTSRNASHTTPLTVAAELGVVGLAAYFALLGGAVRLLLELRRRSRELALGLAAAFLLLFVHSLSYSGFFQDPVAWGVLALAGAALAPVARRAARPLSDTGPPVPAVPEAAKTASQIRGRWQT